jgi:hypothetical protein
MVVAGFSRMTPAAFRQSLRAKAPPADASAALQGLWWAAKDDWEKAHRIVMKGDSQNCAWVHAYLHRLEGDLDNARYWYRQARRKPATHDLSSEWNEIVAALLGHDG